MASEITIQALLSFLKGNSSDDFNFAKTQFTMNGKNYIHRTQSIASTDTTLDMAALTTPGLALFVNRGPSTAVKIKNAAAGTIFPRLNVGEPALFRFDASVTAPVAISLTIVISAVTNATQVEFTCASAHGLAVGDLVIISGFTAGWTGANGTFAVTNVSTTTKFKIAVDSSAFGALSGSPVFAGALLEYFILED